MDRNASFQDSAFNQGSYDIGYELNWDDNGDDFEVGNDKGEVGG